MYFLTLIDHTRWATTRKPLLLKFVSEESSSKYCDPSLSMRRSFFRKPIFPFRSLHHITWWLSGCSTSFGSTVCFSFSNSVGISPPSALFSANSWLTCDRKKDPFTTYLRIPIIWLTWLSRQTEQITIMHCQKKLSNIDRTNLEVGLGVGMIIFVVQSRKVDEHRGVEVTIEVWSSRLRLYVRISLSARDLMNRKALDDFGRLSRH